MSINGNMFRLWHHFTFILLLTISSASGYRDFTNNKGKKFTARIIHKTSVTVTLERKKDRKLFTLKRGAFSAEDQAYIEYWTEGDSPVEEPTENTNLPADDQEAKGPMAKFFPRTKKEIKAGLAEIKRRKRPSDVSKEDFEATELLNVYRFLSSVPAKVKSDAKLNTHSTLAAAACKKNGGLSHSLGDYTDKCNLSGQGNVVRSVQQYMEDFGANNRNKRGHRRWCLNPRMSKTGFGADGNYSAMWALDQQAKSKKKFWSYPGEGYYPEEYLHGNSWSAYFKESVPPTEDIDIRVVKLSKRPEKPPVTIDDLPSRDVEVTFKHSFDNTINFEVEYKGRKKGLYWVEIKGRGVKRRYFVHLY